MTYERAIRILKQYQDWRKDDVRQQMPRREYLDEALQLAISTMKDITDGKTPTSPAELRFNSFGQMIQDFIEGNKI